MENKGTVIAVIWISMVLLSVVLVTQVGVEFLAILILLGIAVAMTFAVMSFGRERPRKEIDAELIELREKVKALNAQVDEMKTQNKE
jgi:hypothetical protein